MYLCAVFVTNASLNVNHLYSYLSKEFIDSFKRVEVEFAHGKNKAIVINCQEINEKALEDLQNAKHYQLKFILKVIDQQPVINNEQYELAKWLSKTTISPFISCLNTMLPKSLRTSVKEKKIILQEIIKINKIDYHFTTKQQEVFSKLTDGMLVSEARKLSLSIINKFIQAGLIEIIKTEKHYHEQELIINDNFQVLTNKQKQVYESFINSDKLVSLLFGVTGSGKTEVYLHLAREYLQKGLEVLILVPEISLTPQMIKRVKERFNEVIFYHSGLNDQERYEQYQRVKEGKVKIVVGTRSSVFLPFHSLGLIIIDEEHDASYKQDSTPCYDAKAVAIKRAINFKARILLASATPSLAAYTRALKGEYGLLRLDERINNSKPNVQIVDLTKEIKNKASIIISNTLNKEIEIALNNHKQVIILLNRRGYSPIVKCGSCGTTLMCQDCDRPLNYHKDENILKCHQCGRIYKLSNYCPKCHQQSLVYLGFGTKRVEEELKTLFPLAKIERMDHDNTSRKGSHEAILKRFEERQIDILIGTQMIAKGLDFPNVTLVGILNADAGLAHQDYNAAKTTLDLLMQASGRSGRALDKGKVIIQAYNPDHYVLKAVLSQDYDYFYKIEMNYRNKTYYPPYSHIVEIIISDSSNEKIATSINFLQEQLNKLNIKYYRPVELAKIMKQRRYRILLCDKDLSSLINAIWQIIDLYLKQKGLAKIKIDIDPLYLE